MTPLRPLLHWSAVIPFSLVPVAAAYWRWPLPIAFAVGVVAGSVWAGWRFTE
jgi:hypothetical protein